MSEKFKAITKTNVKVMINMDIAVRALNATQIKNLHDIIGKLTIWDETHKSKIRKK